MWKTIKRPGAFGKERDQIYKEFNKKYGKGNWRIVWQWGRGVIPWLMACQIYEDAYWLDSFKREKLWKKLISWAKNVYDYAKSNVKSGFDYSVQECPATHLQDISIRRVVLKRGWKFRGEKLIQIRSADVYWGDKLGPGRVPFHLPKLIKRPHLKGWWDANSVEDFYQSNKLLQIRR